MQWFELIPVVSFFVQGARCRTCKKGIGWQYPFVELLSGLIFVFAPGKASVYPEYIPDEYFKQRKKTTNYDILVREMKNNNVAFIDFKDYLISKNISEPLLTKLISTSTTKIFNKKYITK